MTNDEIKEKIERRRRQILFHSCCYYRFNETIIPDSTYDEWANELITLQREFPEIAAQCVYDKDFVGFEGSSGFNLPYYLYTDIVRKILELTKEVSI